MSEFDDLARSNYRRTPPPAQPPAGGWERLRRDLKENPEAGLIPSRFRGGFIWGAIVGAVTVVMLLRLFPGAVANISASPCVEQSMVAATSVPHEIVAEKRESLVVESFPSLSETEAAAAPTTEQINSSNTKVSLSPDFQSLPTKAPLTKQIDTVSKSLLSTSENSVARYSPEVADLLPISTLLPLGRRLPAASFGALPPIQIPAEVQSTLTPKWSFERIDREAQPAHRWEVGLSGFAWKQNQRFYGYELADSPTDADQQGFTTSVDNQQMKLYRNSQFPTSYVDKRPLGFRTAYLEVAHQFPKGLRLGVGLLGMMDGSEGGRRPAEVFTALGRSNELSEVITTSFRALYASFTVQYTVFRRRRFRLSPGITLINHITTVNTTTRFVTLDQQVPTGSQTSLTHSRNSWAPLLSLQMQYQLTRNIAVTGDLLPGIGIGARYQFE